VEVARRAGGESYPYLLIVHMHCDRPVFIGYRASEERRETCYSQILKSLLFG
jgi:hypothetical protein